MSSVSNTTAPISVLTEVTTFTSAPAAIPSSLLLSAELIAPRAEGVASVMAMAGVTPPVLVIGATPVTPVTVPVGVV